jgi:hypothetical protein
MKIALKLLNNQRSITTSMHTDHQDLIGYDAEVICGG